MNNAGIPARIPVTRLTPADVERVMDVNFHAPVRMSLALLPHWLARGSGCVVNVSSLGGRIPIRTRPRTARASSRCAGGRRAMAVDLYGTGVEVKLVLPGPIDTEIWDQPGNDAAAYQGPFVPAADAAESIVDAIEGDGFEYYAPPNFPGGGSQHDIVVGKSNDPGAFVEVMGAMRGSIVTPDDRLYFRQLLAGRDFARDDALARQMVNFVYLVGDRETGEAVAIDPAYGVGELDRSARRRRPPAHRRARDPLSRRPLRRRHHGLRHRGPARAPRSLDDGAVRCTCSAPRPSG